ncbi:hypothetical protein INT45_010571 [Circinella minor]|uniref:Uncharacterized protein n=1 Tax=Circinella minor TaxID=1195481 RepID=A0A8H7S9E3_9FUNG|nr:hypothetical protein INT45_010571 [Circinella minor]
MKASYIIALFAVFAVANAWGSDVYTEDSKTQEQYASGTQGEISDSSGSLVNAQGALHDGVTIAGSHDKNAVIKQEANQ